MATENDASGGVGSFAQNAWGLLTGTVSTLAVPYVAKELGLTQTTDAAGNSRYAAAPTTAAKAPASALLSNPLVILAGVALVGLIVWKAVR